VRWHSSKPSGAVRDGITASRELLAATDRQRRLACHLDRLDEAITELETDASHGVVSRGSEGIASGSEPRVPSIKTGAS
jgi:hypothetical protein